MSLDGRPPRQKQGKPAPNRPHMHRVKALPCVICHRPGPSDAHHVIHDRLTVPKDDSRVIPLCKAHHQNGPDAIHNGKATWRGKYGNDYDFLPVVADMLAGEWNP